MNLKIICVGRMKEKYWIDAEAELIKRISAWGQTDVLELAQETNESPSSLKKEGERILRALPQGCTPVLLDIKGRKLDSEGFAAYLADAAVSGKKPCFIIGGPYGVSDDVKNTCTERISMSDMTFNHRLARIMLLEQIYRAFSINNGGKYHK